MRVTEMAAAAAAKRALFLGECPSARPTAKAPLNASPAAVVSTAFTENAGTRTPCLPISQVYPGGAQLQYDSGRSFVEQSARDCLGRSFVPAFA